MIFKGVSVTGKNPCSVSVLWPVKLWYFGAINGRLEEWEWRGHGVCTNRHQHVPPWVPLLLAMMSWGSPLLC